MKIEEIMERAREELRPGEEERERLRRVAKEIMEKVEEIMERKGLEGEARLGGSYAHGTWLSGQADVDVFILLEPGVSLDEEGVGIALDSARGSRVEIRYAEHPYVRTKIDDVRVELVPCYNVRQGAWISAADRSPYHTEYLLKRLDDEIRDEIRLAKAFMTSIGVYGAEIKVRGFSGYLVEILVLAYGGFHELLDEAITWRKGEIISPEPLNVDVRRFHKGAPLIVPDPVDQRRNIAAAVSNESLGTFILAAERFLRDPSMAFFRGHPQPLTSVNASHLAENIVVVVFEKPDKPGDILWGEVWKTAKGFAAYLNRRGFRVLRYTATEDSYTISIAFLMETTRCCRLKTRKGPSVFMRDARNKFMEARIREGNNVVWIGEDGRLYSLSPRLETTAVEALLEALKMPVEVAGAAKGLVDTLKRTSRVFCGWETVGGGYKSMWLSVLGISTGHA